MYVEMSVLGLTVDAFTNLPSVLLVDGKGRTQIEVWIGQADAAAIAIELENVRLDRPTTHDLMRNILGMCAIQVERAEIEDVKKGSFFARLHLVQGAMKFAVEARPSDALALALRARAPIFVEERVIEKLRRTQTVDLPAPTQSVGLRGIAAAKHKSPRW